MVSNLKKPGSPSPIRVLLAGDHQVLMAGFASTLSAAGLLVAGQAKTPEDAIVEYF
jgi:two-component system invasion response regulator UvrY